MEKKHRYFFVKCDDFVKYQEKYGHTRLDKWNRLWIPCEKPKFLGVNEEIFDGLMTNYDIEQDGDNYLIKFQTNSKTKYRFDISKEPYIKENIYHLSFSLFDRDRSNYDTLTDKNESLEVLNRLIWILKDIVKILPSDYEFCIGITDNDKKNRIYTYILKGISGWEKRNTEHYTTGWGIYFKMN